MGLEDMEGNIFILVLIIIVLMLLYWIYLDYSEKKVLNKPVIEKPIEEKKEYSKPNRVSYELERRGSDYGDFLSFFGFFMGAWIVYLIKGGLTSSVSISDLINFITNNVPSNCYNTGALWESSKIVCEPDTYKINYISGILTFMVTGAILGAVIGWIAGKHIKR